MPRTTLRFPQSLEGMFLIRHAPTIYNEKRADDLERNPNCQTLRSPEDIDSPLSVMGRLSAFICGRYLSAILPGNGHPNLDVLAISTKLRAEQTAEVILHTMQLPDSLGRHFSELNEVRPADPGAMQVLTQQYQDLADQHWHYINAKNPDMSFEDKIRAVATATLHEGASRLVRVAAEHSAAKFAGRYDILERKKTHFGESYLDGRERAREFLQELFELAGSKAWKRIGVLSHGKLIVAMLQLLQGLSDDEARYMLDVEGPPFPPHVSVTVFRPGPRGNALVTPRLQVPAGLVTRGRLLAFDGRVMNEKFLAYACKHLAIKYTEPALSKMLRSDHPHRVRGLSLGKSSNPFIKLRELSPEPPSAKMKAFSLADVADELPTKISGR